MRAYIVRDSSAAILRDAVEVILVETINGERCVLELAGVSGDYSEPMYRWRPAGEDGPPTFTLPAPAWEALLEAAAGQERPTPATIAHRDDAIAVRDRALALVELVVRRGVA